MQNQGQTKKPAVKASGINPFAKALVETESQTNKTKQNTKSDSELLSEALAKTGGKVDSSTQDSSQKEALKKQQEEMKVKQERDALRKKLHDQINPVDNHEVFAARKERETKEIEQLKTDIALLMADLGSLEKEAELTLMTQIVDPGERGTYYKNFFAKLRSFILLLRQKVKSARTWAKQTNFRKKKMAKRKGGGATTNPGETKYVQDLMHHEKASAFNPG